MIFSVGYYKRAIERNKIVMFMKKNWTGKEKDLVKKKTS